MCFKELTEGIFFHVMPHWLCLWVFFLLLLLPLKCRAAATASSHCLTPLSGIFDSYVNNFIYLFANQKFNWIEVHVILIANKQKWQWYTHYDWTSGTEPDSMARFIIRWCTCPTYIQYIRLAHYPKDGTMFSYQLMKIIVNVLKFYQLKVTDSRQTQSEAKAQVWVQLLQWNKTRKFEKMTFTDNRQT